MRSFEVIVLSKLIDRVTQVPLSDQHEAIKALRLDRQNESLGKRVQIGLFGGNRTDSSPPQLRTSRNFAVNRGSRSWIKRVWQIDPLQCPSCGATMRIVSFIEPTQPDVIDAILTHCGLADKPPRAPPNAPPPEIHELQ